MPEVVRGGRQMVFPGGLRFGLSAWGEVSAFYKPPALGPPIPRGFALAQRHCESAIGRQRCTAMARPSPISDTVKDRAHTTRPPQMQTPPSGRRFAL